MSDNEAWNTQIAPSAFLSIQFSKRTSFQPGTGGLHYFQLPNYFFLKSHLDAGFAWITNEGRCIPMRQHSSQIKFNFRARLIAFHNYLCRVCFGCFHLFHENGSPSSSQFSSIIPFLLLPLSICSVFFFFVISYPITLGNQSRIQCMSIAIYA